MRGQGLRRQKLVIFIVLSLKEKHTQGFWQIRSRKGFRWERNNDIKFRRQKKCIYPFKHWNINQCTRRTYLNVIYKSLDIFRVLSRLLQCVNLMVLWSWWCKPQRQGF